MNWKAMGGGTALCSLYIATAETVEMKEGDEKMMGRMRMRKVEIAGVHAER